MVGVGSDLPIDRQGPFERCPGVVEGALRWRSTALTSSGLTEGCWAYIPAALVRLQPRGLMIISIDTETTGVDAYHGALPFFVTMCDERGQQLWWEWDVDPLTRLPVVPPGDVEEVLDLVLSASVVVGQNIKFDVAMLAALDERFSRLWPWGRTHDTLYQAHLLHSNRPKDLTSLVTHWLGRDIQPLEDALAKEVKAARHRVQQAKLRRKRDAKTGTEGVDDPIADYRIAEKDLPEMPSARDETWRYDYWLPRVLDTESTALREYGNGDSATTLSVFFRMEKEIHRRGLEAVYEEKRRLLPIVHGHLERRGMSLHSGRLRELTDEYISKSAVAGVQMVNLAAKAGHELEMPKGASPNASLRKLCFDVYNLPRYYKKGAKTAEPTLGKEAVAAWLEELDPESDAYKFVKALSGKRKRDTAIAYMTGYKRFWVPLAAGGWYQLHPSLNVTGTDTLRWSSHDPNEQNISKKEDFNLRYCFGPAPGREWWALDAKNIELRIPAYEAEEEEFIALFERPDDPPYFGSNHLLIAHLLFPKEFDECLANGESFKKKYASTKYQDTKNGNFAIQYGAVDLPNGRGTADRTYKVPGAQSRIKTKFKRMEAINQKWISFANRCGYVETLPDKSVDPRRGYPLLCTRSEYGDIKPTVPLNFHVQGTAMWWTCRAMVKCYDKLEEWRGQGFDGFITAQVHDEIVFDLPYKAAMGNLPKVRTLRRLMESCGDDIGVPTPVGVEYCPKSYSEGTAVE